MLHLRRQKWIFAIYISIKMLNIKVVSSLSMQEMVMEMDFRVAINIQENW